MVRSQNKGLSEHQRKASRLRTGPSPAGGRGKRMTARARRRRAISTPEMASSTKLWAGSQLLTKPSWDPGWLTSTRRVAVRDQLPRGDTGHTWDSALLVHSGNPGAGTGEVIRHTAQLGEWACQTPGHLSCSDLGRHKTQAQPSLCLCGVPENLNLSGLDLGSACNPGPALDRTLAEQPGTWTMWIGKTHMPREGANPVWPRHCEHSPHTPLIFLWSVPPSPQHNWTS